VIAAATADALREFHRPRVWVGVWAFGWVLCIVLSLIHPPQLGIDVPDGDKIGHVFAYGVLSAWAAWLFATRRARVAACIALVLLGLLLEVAQGEFTSDRMMDPLDGWADLIGVLLGQLAGLGSAGGFLQRLDRRWFARR
jgi:VanZ family protein